jgi:dCMP deaminase
MTRWDAYFRKIAEASAEQSLCLNRKIGAVVVRNKRIIAAGYNGPPEGVPPCADRFNTDGAFAKEYRRQQAADEIAEEGCPRRILGLGHGKGREWCPATHAEVNAIVNAARMGVSTEGAQMYLTCGLPCKNCLSTVINAGISEIICTSYDAHDDLTHWILLFAKLRIRTYE